MPQEHTGQDDAGGLALAPVLDMRQAALLREALLAALAEGTPICLDGGAVERLTTPCAQVLLAAAADAARRHIPFRFNNVSPTLGAGFTALGLASTLNNGSAA